MNRAALIIAPPLITLLVYLGLTISPGDDRRSGAAGDERIELAANRVFTAPGDQARPSADRSVRNACDQVLGYRLGSIDSRFGISEARLLAAASAASQLWEKPAGRPLFRHDRSGAIELDLVFDERQQFTIERRKFAGALEADRSEYERLSKRRESLSRLHRNSREQYVADLRAYERRVIRYNFRVEDWNRKPSFEEEQRALDRERQELETLRSVLRAQESEVDRLRAQANEAADELNRHVELSDRRVERFNSQFGTPRKIRQGEFLSDARGRRINIFQFDGEYDLIRVLAHEFGHALGIGHVSDPSAIMYEWAEGAAKRAPVLTRADLSGLEQACNLRYAPTTEHTDTWTPGH